MAKIDPYKMAFRFVGNDELKPSMHGVYHKGGYVYATDAHVLLKMKSDYPKSREGKILDKNMQQLKVDGEVITKYPNVDSVIPNMSDYSGYTVNLSDIDKALKESARLKEEDFYKWGGKRKRNKRRHMLVFLPENVKIDDVKNDVYSWGKSETGTKGFVSVDPVFFKRTIYPFMKEKGINTIYIHDTRPNSRVIVVKTDKDLAMIMPVLNEDLAYATHMKDEYDVQIVRTKPYGKKPTTAAVELAKEISKTEKKKPKKPTTMKKSACSRKTTATKARKSATTVKDASRILKAQKEDYQKIFRIEVKKAKNPKTGAKKAGQIYRDRYGATATARWKKALKRAK